MKLEPGKYYEARSGAMIMYVGEDIDGYPVFHTDKGRNFVYSDANHMIEWKEALQEEGVFEPEIGEEFWYVAIDGAVKCLNHNGKYGVLPIPLFRTSVEAGHHRDKMVVTEQLRKLAGGYEFVDGQDNYCIGYDPKEEHRFVVEQSKTEIQGPVYFNRIQDVLHAIDTIDDLKLLFGGRA